jgi:YQGE family putative transporter
MLRLAKNLGVGNLSILHSYFSLNREERIFLINVNLFMLGNAISSIFVTLFLWIYTKSFFVIAYYQLFSAVFILAGYLFYGYLSDRVRASSIYRAGILSFLLFYLLLLVLGKKASDFIAVIGTFNGLATGLFYTGNNVLVYDIVHGANRIHYTRLNNVMNPLTGIVGPAISGVFLLLVHGIYGYYCVFAMSLLIFLYALFRSAGINSVVGGHQFSLKKTVAVWFENRSYRHISINDFVRGFVSMMSSIALVALVYISSRYAPYVADFAIISSVMQVLTAMKVRVRQRRALPLLALAGSILMVFSTLLLLPPLSYGKMLLYGTAAGVASPLISIPYSTSVLDAIDTDPFPVRNRTYYIVNREYTLLFARSSAILLFITVYSLERDILYISLLMLCASVLQMVVPFIIGSFYKHHVTPEREIIVS